MAAELSPRIEDKLYQNRYLVDAGRAHIKVREHTVPTPLLALLTACPARCTGLSPRPDRDHCGRPWVGTCRVIAEPSGDRMELPAAAMVRCSGGAAHAITVPDDGKFGRRSGRPLFSVAAPPWADRRDHDPAAVPFGRRLARSNFIDGRGPGGIRLACC
jgi:ferredoxin like protein